MTLKFNFRQSVPEFCDALLDEAVRSGASDLYILPGVAEFELRCRVNGLQRDLLNVPAEFGAQCVTRLKVMAGMLTYRSRIAQDGAIRSGRVEFRLAVMPTIRGERLTIRLFDHSQRENLLDELRFRPEVLAELRKLLERPSGMIILTGATGSGKSTTIYAMIRELLRLDRDRSSIISIEDPVECEIAGISQISLPRDDAEWNYAAALRAALRHDVKTLVIGEMRDREIVKVALDAALTGHRVITTFHAGDIASVFARLLHQGFEPFLIAVAVSGVVTQHLVHAADGSGRLPVAAVLANDDAFRDFLAGAPDLRELRNHLQQAGCDLKAIAAQLAEAGHIAPWEVALL